MAYLNPNKLIILFLILGSLSKAQEKTLYVIHSNNTNGALENCYCPDNPFGSLEKRSVYIENFKKLKGDQDIVIKHTELRKMKDKPSGKIPLSYDEMLEKFKKHRENMKALIAEGKKFRIVNREDLKSISLKPKVFTGTRKRERKRPPIINNSAELKKLRKMRKKPTRKIAFAEKKKKKSKTRKKNRPYTL